MEDALRDKLNCFYYGAIIVLILIVMEDALRVFDEKNEAVLRNMVLILIVMEDALRVTNKKYLYNKTKVLILIVMEDALREMAKCNSFYLLSS